MLKNLSAVVRLNVHNTLHAKLNSEQKFQFFMDKTVAIQRIKIEVLRIKEESSSFIF